MKELKITEDNYANIFKELLTLKEDACWYGVVSKPTVIAGTYDKGNKEVAESLGYFVGENIYTPGGTMVLNEGDVMFGIMRYGNIFTELKNLRFNFVGFLQSKGLNAKVEGNDIIIDNMYKVAGTSHSVVGLRKILVFVISIHETNNSDIRKICNKNTKKVPKGLLSYNISSEDVLEFMKTLI